MSRARLIGIIIANLFAAFGAGGMMIKSLGLASHEWLRADTILSFLVGPLLALALLSVVPKWVKTRGIALFSFATAATALVLIMFLRSADPKLTGWVQWVFFAVMSFRFCFWIVARSLRMNAAAGHEMSLSWTELSYYAGMIASFFAWPVIGANTWGIGSIVKFGTDTIGIASGKNSIVFAALVLDFVFQVVAGIIDARWVHKKGDGFPETETDGSPENVDAVQEEEVSPKPGKELPYYVMSGACVVSLGVALSLVHSGLQWSAVAVLAISFFVYEVISLTVLDRIGEEVPEESGITAIVHNSMYGSAALATWVLVQIEDYRVAPLVVLGGAFFLVQSGLFLGRKPSDPAPKRREVNWSRVIGLALAVIAVTAATESVCFLFIEREDRAGSEGFSSALWAASYIGPAIAAVVCGWYQVAIRWTKSGTQDAAARLVTSRS